jgi:hypothetical protein
MRSAKDFKSNGKIGQSEATCSRWFPARGFFYPEDGGDTFSETSGNVRSTQRHIPEDDILHSHRCESLKSVKIQPRIISFKP